MELTIPAIALALIPINVGLVAIVKPVFDSKWAPIIAVCFGIMMATLIPEPDWKEIILNGIVIGLSSCGLYSGGKAVIA